MASFLPFRESKFVFAWPRRIAQSKFFILFSSRRHDGRTRRLCGADLHGCAVGLQNRTHRHNAPHAAEQTAAPMCVSDLCHSSTVSPPPAGGIGGQGSPCKLRFGTKMLSKATSHQKDTEMVSFGKHRHAGKASSFPARRKAVQIRRDLRPSEAAARWQDCLDPAGFSNGFVKFIEKCVADRKGLKSRVNSCILKIKITAGPDRWSAGVMDGSKREGVIKKSRKVNTEERDLVGRTAAHGAHQQTIR